MKKIWQCLAVSFLITTLVGCRVNNERRDVHPIRVKTQTVNISDGVYIRNYVGVIEEETAAALSFQVMGSIESFLVNEGTQVKKGELLATLNHASAQSAYSAAKASLLQAEDAHRRMKAPYDQKTLPEIKMVEMDSKLEQARSMYEISKKNLADCSLYAPFSGVIGKRNGAIGETATPGIPVMTLLNTQTLKVKISVPENEIALLSP